MKKGKINSLQAFFNRKITFILLLISLVVFLISTYFESSHWYYFSIFVVIHYVISWALIIIDLSMLNSKKDQ